VKQAMVRAVKSSPALEQLYRRAVAVVPYGWRQGSAFWDFYRLLERTQHLPPERLAEMQFERVQQMLRWAYGHSGFYRRLYDAHGVHPRDIRTPDDFAARIPVVDRDLLAAAPDLRVPMRGAIAASTSGTSGSPFEFTVDRKGNAMEQAAIFHQWARAGYRPGDLRVELRGFQVAPVYRSPDHRVVRLSVVNMEAHLPQMVALMDRLGARFLHGYPSALAKLAVLMRERGLRLARPPRGVLLASENVYDWQTEVIDEVIAPRTLMAHYGQAEKVVLGAWCEERRAYHFLPLYGMLEQGPAGEVIGTGLVNRATPVIRYRLNDVLLDRSDAPCPSCGRGLTPLVERIGGRMEDYLVDHKGELVPPAVVTFPFKHLRYIRQAQVVQQADRAIVLRCVQADGPAEGVEAERATLRENFGRMLGHSIPVRFERVDEIPLTAACKFRWIVSEAVRPVPQ
jgi:phenylacetate-CoA ligase